MVRCNPETAGGVYIPGGSTLAKPLEARRGTLQVRVTDVLRVAERYARLGLPVLVQSRKRALVDLPCGVTLVLSRIDPLPRVTAAA